MRHSTNKPTKRESAYIEACKLGPCVACHVFGVVTIGGDFHHTKSGNIRRGHMFGMCLCGWHHRGLVHDGWTHKAMREVYGPSLMDGSRLFRLTYGSDDDLLKLQRELIGWEDDSPGD